MRNDKTPGRLRAGVWIGFILVGERWLSSRCGLFCAARWGSPQSLWRRAGAGTFTIDVIAASDRWHCARGLNDQESTERLGRRCARGAPCVRVAPRRYSQAAARDVTAMPLGAAAPCASGPTYRPSVCRRGSGGALSAAHQNAAAKVLYIFSRPPRSPMAQAATVLRVFIGHRFRPL